jgi:hypothetical protein
MALSRRCNSREAQVRVLTLIVAHDEVVPMHRVHTYGRAALLLFVQGEATGGVAIAMRPRAGAAT